MYTQNVMDFMMSDTIYSLESMSSEDLLGARRWRYDKQKIDTILSPHGNHTLVGNTDIK